MTSVAKEPQRRYSTKTIKVLFAFSGNQCAEPNCTCPIISPGTAVSDALVVGQIAHIFAFSKDGPRGRANLSEAEINQPSNLILLCPTHHVIVDGQPETYPAELLFSWKAKHERKYSHELSQSISEVGYAELELAAQALMAVPTLGAGGSLINIPPKEKIAKNGLGATSEMLLTMGSSKSQEVAEVLIKASQLDAAFPDRLRNGFVSQYRQLRQGGFQGDELFTEMYEWAAGHASSKTREAAGLCVLSHLFIICDVFEK